MQSIYRMTSKIFWKLWVMGYMGMFYSIVVKKDNILFYIVKIQKESAFKFKGHNHAHLSLSLQPHLCYVFPCYFHFGKGSWFKHLLFIQISYNLWNWLLWSSITCHSYSHFLKYLHFVHFLGLKMAFSK
jgi:hypothetical protein